MRINSVTVSWNAPTNNGGSDISDFTVYWSTIAEVTKTSTDKKTVGGTGTSLTGWYDDHTGGSKFAFGTAGTGTAVTTDITLYAQWLITKQTTTYKIGDSAPAGGIVFYTKSSYSDGWRYMESPTSDTSTSIKWGGSGIRIG